jgi:hypothetical protein
MFASVLSVPENTLLNAGLLMLGRHHAGSPYFDGQWFDLSYLFSVTITSLPRDYCLPVRDLKQTRPLR